MWIGLLLGLATPSPAPVLPALKTITNIRATPFCTALREHVAPAISSILTVDAIVDKNAGFFADTRRPSGYELRQSMGRLHMENVIGPIVSDMDAARSQIQRLPDDAAYAPMKSELADVLERQNDELNAITGYLATQAMNDLRGAATGPAFYHASRYPRITAYQAASKAFWDAQDRRRAAEQAASESISAAMDQCAPTDSLQH